ncbi:hypothetical protein Pla108_26730 [Botrimarina colliarenosi]|uniref:Dockerin domain-containing protein n=1 Tax=Botrimarina colliarenosi TaxID=2528001 RepID=A0A5C6AC47_9BACT|nr:dockerin type I repeat-containing protein [Botrimarina colliarenosi]TWT96898.1 hypothetical protein Pla108_26730 [Botrimarina colliarenosi]
MNSLRTLLTPLALLLVTASPLLAAKIDLRLDVTYAGAVPSAGGTWKLFAKTDEVGLFSLGTTLLGVNAAITPELPRGRVNGSASDNAGFATFSNKSIGATQELYLAQQVAPMSAAQQGVFYGVGTLDNGSPNYPGRQAGTSSLGPNITSLTAVQSVPWALADPLWATGVTVASGTFAVGATPRFSASAGDLEGSLLTSLGGLSAPGDITLDVAFTTLVSTNLDFGVATGDYNGDGRVNAADYTYWRDRLNQNVTPLTSADGNGDGVINGLDYTVWTTHYGDVAPVGIALAVPEPGALFSAALGGLLLAGKRLSHCGRPGKTKHSGGIA